MSKITLHDVNAYYELNRAKLIAKAYKSVKDPETAEDLVHDVFLKLLESNNFENITYLETYISVALRNKIKDYKKTHRDIESLESVSEETLSANDPLKKIIIAEKLKETERAISELPARQRQVLRLKAHEDLSYEQIANKLSISTEAVKKNLLRARLNLKLKLKQRKGN